jgi:molybdopterin-guanine dinucleotide biosynthesis protein A
MPLWRSASLVAQGCDLCLVEGYRGKELPRIEVKSEGGRAKRITGRVLMTVTDAVAQTAETERVVRRFLDERSAALPTMALILIGGRSRRMGRPKSMLKSRGESVLERVVAAAAPHVERMLLGGRGVTPPSLAGMARLPDAPGLQGPLAGILSAMRWRPEAHWLVLACDLPLIEARAVLWLLSKRRAGADALLPRLGRAAPVEPLFALYEPTCRLLLELAARDGELSPRRALAAARLLTPVVPLPLRPAWTNVNTPDEWRRAQT